MDVTKFTNMRKAGFWA